MARTAASQPSGVLDVFLLGAFRVERNSHSLHLPHRKVELLFTYLVLHPQEHSREKLAALFWGDSSDLHARHSFRTALTAIRKTLGDDILLADRATVQINPAEPVWVDAVEFERAAESAPSALDLYQGDLLADFYDDWILPERDHYRVLYLTALLRLAQEMRALSEYERAIAYAQRALAAEPTNERAHQHLMFCYVALGDRPAALKQYAECVRILRDDLAVEPTRETTALAEWIEQAPAVHPPGQARLTNLPIPLTSFIGRKREMAEGKRLVASRRLVTLTGAGGSGKTRLAIQISTDLVDAFRDGVWWVELAALTEEALVPQAVAQALGVREVPNQPLSETLIHFLCPRRLLLVLDNCEHLVNACAEIATQLLGVCPDLKVLATSRETLGLTGEVALPVPTLALPDPKQVALQDLLMQFEGIRLFVERAVAVKQDFVVTPQNARAVLEVCRRLDGIPLAIELAAARAKILTVEHIAARLDTRFDLLTTGSRTALPRQKTLRATIDWSYDLLAPDAQKLFRRLSVFAGGFTLDAAEAICSDASLEQSAVLQVLSRLVDRSLVLVEQRDGNERYHMLETIREYAFGKLVELNEADEIRKKHGQFYADLARKAEPNLQGSEQFGWLERLEEENLNLRATLMWSVSPGGDSHLGLCTAGSLWRFWWLRGHLVEGRTWLTSVLSRANALSTTMEYAKASKGAGDLAYYQGDYAAAHPLYEASLTISRQYGDKPGIANAMNGLGNVAFSQGDYTTAGTLYDDSLAIRRELGDRWGIANSLCNLGGLAQSQGDLALASTLLEECLVINRELGDKRGIAFLLNNLGNVTLDRGESARAHDDQMESLRLYKELGDKWGVAYSLDSLGDVEQSQGNYAAAYAYYQESLTMLQGLGDKFGIVCSIEAFSRVAQGRQQPDRATTLLGAADALRKMIGAHRQPSENAEYDRAVATIQGQMDQVAFTHAWANGLAMTSDDAVAYALQTE